MKRVVDINDSIKDPEIGPSADDGEVDVFLVDVIRKKKKQATKIMLKQLAIADGDRHRALFYNKQREWESIDHFISFSTDKMASSFEVFYTTGNSILLMMNARLGKFPDDLSNHICVYTEKCGTTTGLTLEFLEQTYQRFNGPDNPLSNTEKQKFLRDSASHTR